MPFWATTRRTSKKKNMMMATNPSPSFGPAAEGTTDMSLLAAAAMLEQASSTRNDPANRLHGPRSEKTHDQKMILMRAYKEEPMPSFETRQALARATGLTPHAVRIWF